MSQFFLTSTGTGPSTPISFVTNSGTAAPSANILNVLSAESVINNDNGTTTTGSGNTVTILLTNRQTNAITTTDATPTTALALILGGVAGVYSVEGNLVAFNTTDVAGASYSFTSGVRTDGATATQIGTQFKDLFEEVAMINADFNVITSGNNFIIQVVGIAAKTIDWNCYLTYRLVN